MNFHARPSWIESSNSNLTVVAKTHTNSHASVKACCAGTHKVLLVVQNYLSYNTNTGCEAAGNSYARKVTHPDSELSKQLRVCAALLRLGLNQTLSHKFLYTAMISHKVMISHHQFTLRLCILDISDLSDNWAMVVVDTHSLYPRYPRRDRSFCQQIRRQPFQVPCTCALPAQGPLRRRTVQPDSSCCT